MRRAQKTARQAVAPRIGSLRRALAFGGFALLAACSKPVALLEIPATDLSNLEPAVQTRIAQAKAQFDQTSRGHPSNAELAAAYGELAMVYHAQDLATPAEPAYIDASRLAPGDKRWPYLLGHLYADSNRVAEATAQFQRTLQIDPNDVAAAVSLAQLYFVSGKLDGARELFQRSLSNKDARAAAATGLGKIALAQGRYQEAADRLEEALRLWPSASRLRQPLAMAYRGLGDTARAEQNLALYAPAGAEPEVADPAVDQLSAKVVVSKVLLRRGQQFGKEGRFDLAAQAFRAAVASDPHNAEALANLGISLANLGQTEEARARLEESLRLDDSDALAHFSLGVVYDRQGHDEQAIASYARALEKDPGNQQALVYMADAVMRSGAAAKAADLYRRALAQSPGSSRITMSLALALVKAGRPDEARKVLETELAARPGTPEVVNALARLLATGSARGPGDGARALKMAQPLFESTRSLAVGQTYAMALARVGRFDEAVRLQQETIIGYQRSGSPVDTAFLQRNLDAYLRHQPAEAGWSTNDGAFQPRSPAVAH